MAEEEKKEKEGEGDAAAAAAPKGGSGKMLLIGGGAVVLLLAIGAPVTVLMMRKAPEKTEESSVEHDAAHEEGLVPEGSGEEDQLEEGEEPIGAIFPLEPFVVNLADGGYLRCQVQLEFETRDVPQRLYARLVPIRDAILTQLSRQKKEDLTQEDGKKKLKGAIQDLVNEAMRKADVRNVYFTQFFVK